MRNTKLESGVSHLYAACLKNNFLCSFNDILLDIY